MNYLLVLVLMIFVVDQQPAQASAAVAAQRKKAAMQQQGAIPQGMTPEQQQQYIAMQQAVQAQGGGPVSPEQLMQQKALQEQQAQAQVKDVAEMKDVINSLSVSARDWTLIIDAPAKEAVVSFFIAQFQHQGAVIKKPALYYSSMIDSIVQTQPEMLTLPLPNILQILAVLDYDFENGQNKDAMAMRILKTQDAVMKNRQRLGL